MSDRELDGIIKISRALISLTDKTGLLELAKILVKNGVELVSTGGTHKALQEAGFCSREASEFTGFPEGLGGRVKTLHPFIHGGLLARRGLPEDEAFIAKHGILLIDLLVCNLYPFGEVTKDPACSLEKAIENIDIGGPAMVRSAAKNHASVVVLTNPNQYTPFMLVFSKGNGSVPTLFSKKCAIDAFVSIAAYDIQIANHLVLATNHGQSRLQIDFPAANELRYGENPHQKASLYLLNSGTSQTLARSCVLNGKELSYNNWLDLDAAWMLALSFPEPSAVVVKHTNPCGAAQCDSLESAFLAAYNADPVSAYGGIVAFNRSVDRLTAEAMVLPGRFIECIVAPAFSKEALEILTTKPSWRKNVRLVEVGMASEKPNAVREFRSIDGGLLVQSRDVVAEGNESWKVASHRRPSQSEILDLEIAWKIAAHVKSNAIVLVRNGILVGVGQGQTSRVESVKLAIQKAGDRTYGSSLGSDAFFPFRDGVDEALKVGIKAFIQPGGSIRDAESVAACDDSLACMVFTGIRHFKH